MRILLCLYIALVGLPLAIASGLSAETPDTVPYHWRNVTVGAGGFAPNIIFSSAERGLAYLRTDMGGAYRWDSRARRWIPLQDMLAEGSYQGVESIAADPTDPDVVYLAAGMYRRDAAAILRSTDRGAHWQVVPVPFRMGGNEPGRGLGERLAIDPNQPRTLFFGSRHDGLFRSDDSGRSWNKVAGFPLGGHGLPAPGKPTNAGIAFVLFDPASGTPGQGSRTIYAGSADPGDAHLFRSTDGGRSWRQVTGGPPSDLLPVKAAIDEGGALYIAYTTGIGPNDIARGAVWRLDSKTGEWRDITPDPTGEGGYMGLSLDRQRRGTLVVSSINRWRPGDTVWRSTDGGATWDDLGARSRRDISASPFLALDGEEADFGHWTAGLAIDPFDGNRITGATVYLTEQGAKSHTQLWKPWVKEIEQTAIISLASPTGGAHLISGFGDIRGFVHDDLSRSPPHSHRGLATHNTNQIDYAGLRPEIVVRSGTGRAIGSDGATMAWSDDGGRDWTPLRTPVIRPTDEAPGKRYDLTGEASIVVSADGATFIVNTPVPLLTRDRGKNWAAARGLPLAAQVIADKHDPSRFYAADWTNGRLLASSDSGASFAAVAGRDLPDIRRAGPRHREHPFPLIAEPARPGRLWLLVDGALWHSGDGGASFAKASDGIAIERFGLGKAAAGSTVPALYATGESDGTRGVFRSTDGGGSWLRINDDAHQWGLRFRVITGDPRLFGRVYIGTDGRGIVYGDPR